MLFRETATTALQISTSDQHPQLAHLHQKQGYGFTYDGLNRLKSSSYGEGSSTSAPEFAIPLTEIGFFRDDMGRPYRIGIRKKSGRDWTLTFPRSTGIESHPD